jgi:hypothetical protein
MKFTIAGIGLIHFILAVPHEFTSIPFPVKALKILVHDLRSGGESAAINGQGEDFEVDSDDGVSFVDSCRSLVHAISYSVA